MKKHSSAIHFNSQPPFKPTLLPFWDSRLKRLFYGDNLAKGVSPAGPQPMDGFGSLSGR